MRYTLFFSVIFALNGLYGMTQHVLFIAHRGASFDAPENTLAAINLAWRQGADAVEVDVHLSADHRIMVIHDEDTERTTGKKWVIKDTGSDQLRTLDAGIHNKGQYIGEHIPFLEEVLETIPPQKKLFIEIKSDQQIIPYLKDILMHHEKRSQLVFIGFDFEIMEIVKERMPDIPVYWLHFSVAGIYNLKHIERIRQAGLDGLNFHSRGLREDYIVAAHEQGLKIFAWTVDDPQEAQRLMEAGIDGITSNRPKWLKNQVSNQ